MQAQQGLLAHQALRVQVVPLDLLAQQEHRELRGLQVGQSGLQVQVGRQVLRVQQGQQVARGQQDPVDRVGLVAQQVRVALVLLVRQDQAVRQGLQVQARLVRVGRLDPQEQQVVVGYMYQRLRYFQEHHLHLGLI